MWKIACVSIVFGAFLHFTQVESCNEAVCGSIVSKCLLTQSCRCDPNNCSTCCKDCFNCLSYLYDECCSCVELCPKVDNFSDTLSKQSHVEDFTEPVPGLFNVLTEYPDPQGRWNSTTFSIDIDASQYKAKSDIKIHMQSAEQEVAPIKNNNITLNCTVAFLSDCMNWIKCKSGCQTMGANSYRWFHDGCCECIGQNCINYGINESRCRNCPVNNSDDLITDDVDYDYGESPENESD